MGGQSFEYADLKGDFFARTRKTNDDNGLMNFSKRIGQAPPCSDPPQCGTHLAVHA